MVQFKLCSKYTDTVGNEIGRTAEFRSINTMYYSGGGGWDCEDIEAKL